MLRELRLIAVGIEAAGTCPTTMMLLQETERAGRILPIELTATEVGELEAEWLDRVAPRPTTLRLLGSMITALDRRLDQVRIDGEADRFRAELIFDADTAVPARPGDAVMLALQQGVPVLVEEALLARSALPVERVTIADVGPEAAEVDAADVDGFRSFLDEVEPEDFDRT
ncbi:MAG TPA: bifunctional nuclease domain-containing protein [Pseudonocardia sp.]|nr:bifunctional nuclease domain-containing protein [Pseudonocardia sp.]